MTQACKFCGQQIQMVKNSEGRWMPENPDGSEHRCRNNQASTQPKELGKRPPVGAVEQKPLDQKPDMKAASTLVPEAELRVRELAREEIVKFLTKALTG